MPSSTNSEEYRDLLIAQRRLTGCITDVDTVAKDVSACARVLVAVIDQKRILRMKPKPKDIDVTKQPSRRRVAQRNEPSRPIFTLALPPTPTDTSNPPAKEPSLDQPTQQIGGV